MEITLELELKLNQKRTIKEKLQHAATELFDKNNKISIEDFTQIMFAMECCPYWSECEGVDTKVGKQIVLTCEKTPFKGISDLKALRSYTKGFFIMEKYFDCKPREILVVKAINGVQIQSPQLTIDSWDCEKRHGLNEVLKVLLFFGINPRVSHEQDWFMKPKGGFSGVEIEHTIVNW